MPHSYYSNEPWERGKFVIGEGFFRSRAFLSGRNPGEVEKRLGWPFRGPAGNELNMYLLHSGLQRADFYTSNLYKYATPNDEPPVKEQFDTHWPIFTRELALVRPQILAVFGADANKYIFNKCGIEWRDIESDRSIPLSVSLPIQDGLSSECEQDLPEDPAGVEWYMNLLDMAPIESDPLELILFPATHPAAGIHQVSTMVTILDDFERLAATLAGRIKPRKPKLSASGQKAPQGTSDDLEASRIGNLQPVGGILETAETVKQVFGDFWARTSKSCSATSSKFCSIDTEGQKERPWGLTFSLDGVRGYCIRAGSQNALHTFRDCLLDFITQGGRVALHNSLHDLAVLTAMNIDLPDGSYVDTMVMAYLLGKLPQGLKPLSSRLLNVRMNSYDDMVQPYREAAGRLYLEAAGAIDWSPCRFCGAAGADLTEHPKGGVGAYPREWFRKDGKTVRAKFKEQVPICNAGLLIREVAFDKFGDPYFRRQMNLNTRVQRALKDFSMKAEEGAINEPDAWKEMAPE